MCVCARLPGVCVQGIQGGDSGVGGWWVAPHKATAGDGHQHAGARLQADLQQPPAATSAVTHIHQQGDIDVDTVLQSSRVCRDGLTWIGSKTVKLYDINIGFQSELSHCTDDDDGFSFYWERRAAAADTDWLRQTDVCLRSLLAVALGVVVSHIFLLMS